jgi:CheY-like chemotaxis protein
MPAMESSADPRPARATPPCEGILIVDDDMEIRSALRDVLEDEGYAVAEASDGSEALRELKAPTRSDEQLPCVILLDLMMPVMDGWQFRAAQVQDPRLTKIPVVILTADLNARQKTAALNVSRTLTKPVKLDVLLSTIQQFC